MNADSILVFLDEGPVDLDLDLLGGEMRIDPYVCDRRLTYDEPATSETVHEDAEH
jgi:hypothetical protein